MTKEEYLLKQKELRDRRGEALSRHREVIDDIERRHREKVAREDDLYRMAKRLEYNAYTQEYQAIEMEMMALEAEWYDAHPECPMKDWHELAEVPNAARQMAQCGLLTR